ncbi:MAG: hypothetical protein AB1813_09665 [Verrucomicrobiota bacterium]
MCLVFILSLPAPSLAQTVEIHPLQNSIVVGAEVDYAGYNFLIQFQVVATGVSASAPLNLAVSGAPAGVTTALSASSITVEGTTTVTLTNTVAKVSKGIYPLTISASGAATATAIITLSAGPLWTGSGPSSTWSLPANWSTGSIPTLEDDVKIEEPSGRTIGLDDDFTIGSLSFLPLNNNIDDVTLNLGSHVLTISGPRGFYMGSELPEDRPRLTVSGTGMLVVTNESAPFVQNNLTGGGNQGQLLMNNLNTFIAHVDRFGIGDASLSDRGGRAAQRTLTRLAKTNIVRAAYRSEYFTPDFDTAIQLFKNQPFNNGQSFELNLGIWNEFYADSFGIAMGRAGSDNNLVRFNPSLTGSGPKPFARFRNTDGQGPMTFLAIGVDTGEQEVSSSNRGRLDLRGGTVDMQVDTVWLGVNRSNVTLNANASIRGRLLFDAGTIEASVIRAGYQRFIGDAKCEGYLQVDGTGLLIVKDYLELGFGAGDETPGFVSQGFGEINMTGGTIQANKITIGSALTLNNAITLQSGAKLVLSNALASAELPLQTLTMNDSKLVLHVDAARTAPYVFVRNLVTGGAGNTVEIASLANATSFPLQVALISYESASPNMVVQLPPGLFGFVVNNTANKTIDAVISTQEPASLIWDGTIDGHWDTITANWRNGSSARFSEGDFVTFDDSATGPTTVTVIGAVLPGQSATKPGTTVNNSTKNYTLTGGIITGTGRTVKEGSGSLTIDLESRPPIAVNAGTVHITAKGAVGQATVAAGAALQSDGTINGGLTSAGSAANRGAINGPVTITSGGFVNSGTITTAPGTLTIGGGLQWTNLAAGLLTVTAVGGNNWSIPAGAALANFGRIENVNGRLNVNSGATLFGTGIVTDNTGDINGNNGRLAINGGGTFSPGSAPTHSIGTFTVEGRLDLNQNARLLIEVDLDHPAKNDVVAVDKWSNIRGIIVMTNIGTAPFAIGQSFLIVSNNFGLVNTPETANLDYVFEPASPGPGLQWDDSKLILEGIVSIVKAPINPTPPAIRAARSGNSITVSWPATHVGWQLQEQTGNLAGGISRNPADWTVVAGSETQNQATIPIEPGKPAAFFRLLLPP